MKVLLINHADLNGGAARAASRLLQALQKHPQVSSARMWVSVKQSSSESVDGPSRAWQIKLVKVWSRLSRWANLLHEGDNPGTHSPWGLGTTLAGRINASDADIVHLHWVNNGTLSIGDIARIRKPVVWTFHDMWPFCGAEHYTFSMRWQQGYAPGTKAPSERGLDINRWTWRAKKRLWTHPIQVIAPSHWMGACVKQSALMGAWPVAVLPNTIDVNQWRPLARSTARQQLGIPAAAKVLMFGAVDGGDPRKGFDLLQAAARLWAQRHPDAVVLVVGRSQPLSAEAFPLKLLALGHIADDEQMRRAYCAADAFVLPSRQDNLPNTALEAQACGVPVVGFEVGGLTDIVIHGQTGYLAPAFDVEALAEGMSWVFDASGAERQARSEAARLHAVSRWSPDVVASAHVALYSASLRTSPAKESLTP